MQKNPILRLSLALTLSFSTWVGMAAQQSVATQSSSVAVVPNLINYSGVLTDLSGKPLSGDSPGVFRDAGIGFISDDRHAEGVFLNLTLRERLSQFQRSCTAKRVARAGTAGGEARANDSGTDPKQGDR